jgi:hypothetical protein
MKGGDDGLGRGGDVPRGERNFIRKAIIFNAGTALVLGLGVGVNEHLCSQRT